MKLDVSEILFVDELFKKSMQAKEIVCDGEYEIKKLTGDASTRRYYRVSCPKYSYVVCLADPSPEDASGPRFYRMQGIFNNNNIPVPAIFDYDKTIGYFLEQDLGDNTLLQALSEVDNLAQELNYYKKALDELIKIHKIKLDDSENAAEFLLAFDFEKLYSETEFTHKYLYQHIVKFNMSVEDDKELRRSFVNLCNRISNKKMVATHRDFHSRNIMLSDDQFFIIDFQDARKGIPQYDLVSILEDCYYNIDLKNLDELKEYYWNKFYKGFDKTVNKDEFLEIYDLMTVQRVYKALGSFAYIYSIRSDIRYLKYIGNGFEKIKKILNKYPKYNELRKILSRAYYGN